MQMQGNTRVLESGRPAHQLYVGAVHAHTYVHTCAAHAHTCHTDMHTQMCDNLQQSSEHFSENNYLVRQCTPAPPDIFQPLQDHAYDARNCKVAV
mmetsp:Transcript_17636/g.27909  ORF Transcript_17636/g.27909 Transcript_17636/m.27909 type:complete len:95 (-) Transcript_17636:1391-1675(-)